MTSSEIDNLLLKLKSERETTLVVVTHNIPGARRIGDEFVVLHEGHFIAHGTAEELDRSKHAVVQQFMHSEGGRLMPSSRNYVVGLFVVTGVLLFAVGLFMIGDRRKLFSKDFEVVAEFKELGGLQDGANVKVGGMDAGEVIDIEVPPQPQSKFRVRMRVLEKLHAVGPHRFGGHHPNRGSPGKQVLEDDEGTPSAPIAPSGGTIPGREPFDFADLMEQIRDTVDEVKGKMDGVFASIATTSQNANELIRSVRGDVENIIATSRKVSHDVQVITAGSEPDAAPWVGCLTTRRLLTVPVEPSATLRKRPATLARFLNSSRTSYQSFKSGKFCRKWNKP